MELVSRFAEHLASFQYLEVVKLISIPYCSSAIFWSHHLTHYLLIGTQVELNLLSLPLKQGIIFVATVVNIGITSSNPLVYIVNKAIISKGEQ